DEDQARWEFSRHRIPSSWIFKNRGEPPLRRWPLPEIASRRQRRHFIPPEERCNDSSTAGQSARSGAPCAAKIAARRCGPSGSFLKPTRKSRRGVPKRTRGVRIHTCRRFQLLPGWAIVLRPGFLLALRSQAFGSRTRFLGLSRAEKYALAHRLLYPSAP